MKRNFLSLMCVALVFGALSGCEKQKAVSTPVKKAHISRPKPKVWSKIKKVVLVLLENTEFDDAMAQPFFKELAKKGALLTQYIATTHPSQPNYVSIIAGSTLGVDSNNPYSLAENHLGDLLEAAGKTWKNYAEGYPGGCFLDPSSGAYFRKHVPFLSFKNIQTTPRCAFVTNADHFYKDFKNQTLPDFSFYSPDMNNSGHDTGIQYATRWLSGFYNKVTEDSKKLEDTLFIVTFDEGTTQLNRVSTLFFGAGVQVGATSAQDYTHYSLLRTVEEIFGLSSSLGRGDQDASLIDDIWLSE